VRRPPARCAVRSHEPLQRNQFHDDDGRARKSLAEQIDRLDAILDGLGDALTEAVAAAVSQAVGRAVKEAVQAVMAEVLANPAVRGQALHVDSQPAAQADSPSVPRPPARLATWLGARVRSCVQTCFAGLRWARDTAVRLFLLAKSRLRAALLAAGAVAAGVAKFTRGQLTAVAGRLCTWAMGLAATVGPALRWPGSAAPRRVTSCRPSASAPCRKAIPGSRP
jgi:hypothetical protein